MGKIYVDVNNLESKARPALTNGRLKLNMAIACLEQTFPSNFAKGDGFEKKRKKEKEDTCQNKEGK